MGRVSDMQIEEMREEPQDPITEIEWDIRELKSMISTYEVKPGFEEIAGTLLRAKVLLEMKEGFR